MLNIVLGRRKQRTVLAGRERSERSFTDAFVFVYDGHRIRTPRADTKLSERNVMNAVAATTISRFARYAPRPHGALQWRLRRVPPSREASGAR